MDNQAIEDAIQSKGLTAPRITLDHIKSSIDSEAYHRFEGTNLIICMLILKNGYSVTGESACVDSANFNEELGRKIARGHAEDKIWGLLGFQLASTMSDFTIDS